MTDRVHMNDIQRMALQDKLKGCFDIDTYHKSYKYNKGVTDQTIADEMDFECTHFNVRAQRVAYIEYNYPGFTNSRYSATDKQVVSSESNSVLSAQVRKLFHMVDEMTERLDRQADALNDLLEE